VSFLLSIKVRFMGHLSCYNKISTRREILV